MSNALQDPKHIRAVWPQVAGVCWIALTSLALVFYAQKSGFWLDELSSYWLSNGSGAASVFERMIRRGDPHPPGYQLLLHFWMQVPGVRFSAWGCRFPSVASYALTALFGMLLLRRVSKASFVPLLFCALFGSLAYLPRFATELRGYMSLQAALMAFLYSRELLRSRDSTSARVLAQVAAFYLATAHYTGSVWVGLSVLFEIGPGVLARWRQERTLPPWASVRFAAGYLLGPVCSAAWLFFGPPREALRQLPVPSLDKLTAFFRTAVGFPQVVVLVGLLLLGCLAALRSSSVRWEGAAFALQRLGVLEALAYFATLLVLLPVKSAIQLQTILIVLPPLVAGLAWWIGVSVRERLGYLAPALLLVFAVNGFAARGALKAWHSPTRHGQNFGAVAKFGKRGPLVVVTDDIAQKVIDANALLPKHAQVKRLRVFFLREELRTRAGSKVPKLPPGQTVVLACVHCSSAHRRAFNKFRRHNHLRGCRYIKATKRELVLQCRTPKKKRGRS